MPLPVARSGAGTVAVPQPGAGEDNACRVSNLYDGRDVAVVVDDPIARAVARLSRARGAVAGTATEPAVIVAMLPRNVREGAASWTSASVHISMAGITAGRRAANRTGFGMTSLAVRRVTQHGSRVHPLIGTGIRMASGTACLGRGASY